MTKKIAIIISSLNGGGAEKVCLTLAAGFNALGHESHLIVLDTKPGYDLPEGLKATYIFPDSRKKLYKSSVQTQAAQLIKGLADQQGGFDLVLANLESVYPIAALADLLNTYYVVHNSVGGVLKRTFKLGPFKYWRKRRAYRALEGKHVITVSEGLAEELRQGKYFNPTSVHCIYNPIDENSIRERSNENVHVPTQPYVIHVGRFAAQKRHDVLFKAFKKLDENLHLVLLCRDSQKLRRAIAKAGIAQRVHVMGFQQNPYPFIKHAKALVLSSDFEGLALVLLEALVCGTPVASTRCAHGPSEILQGELAEFLSIPGDTIELANNTQKALQSPMLFSEYELPEAFSVSGCVDAYLSLLES